MSNADRVFEGDDGASRVRAVLEMCRALVCAPDLDAALESIVYAAVQGTERATSGAMWFFDDEEERPWPRPSGAAGATGADGEEARLLALGRTVAREALERECVVSVADVAEDPRFAPMGLERPRMSLLVAPLGTLERPIGVLILGSRTPDGFTRADEQLASSLAAIAAEAIERKNAEMTEDPLPQGQSHLLCADLSRLLLDVAHDLRNPLTAVMGYGQLLQTTEGMSSAVLRDLEKIQSQAQKAAQVVGMLSAFARQYGSTQSADLNDLLRQILALCARALKNGEIRVETDLAPQGLIVAIEPPRLQQVLLRVVSHVRDACSGWPEGGYLQVSTEARGEKARLRCTFGPACLPSHRMGDGESASRAATLPAGLGLCSAMVQEWGGRVRFVDCGGGVMTWIAELPLVHDAGRSSMPVRVGESDRAGET